MLVVALAYIHPRRAARRQNPFFGKTNDIVFGFLPSFPKKTKMPIPIINGLCAYDYVDDTNSINVIVNPPPGTTSTYIFITLTGGTPQSSILYSGTIFTRAFESDLPPWCAIFFCDGFLGMSTETFSAESSYIFINYNIGYYKDTVAPSLVANSVYFQEDPQPIDQKLVATPIAPSPDQVSLLYFASDNHVGFTTSDGIVNKLNADNENRVRYKFFTALGIFSSTDCSVAALTASITYTTKSILVAFLLQGPIACIHGSSRLTLEDGTQIAISDACAGTAIMAADQSLVRLAVDAVPCWLKLPRKPLTHEAVVFEPDSIAPGVPSELFIVDTGHPICAPTAFQTEGKNALRTARSFLGSHAGIRLIRWEMAASILPGPNTRYDLVLDVGNPGAYLANNVCVKARTSVARAGYRHWA